MALDLNDCLFHGPALPDPFVKFELERELERLKLLPKSTGSESKKLLEEWQFYTRKLKDLAAQGGSIRVRNHVIEPLMDLMGYNRIEDSEDIRTREDLESGGVLLLNDDASSKLRLWTTSYDEDLYAPTKRGRAYRYSHLKVAQRVLLATGERLGILTNGVHLVLLISDPARPDSTVSIPIETSWKRRREIPDSFRFFLAMARPEGVRAIPDLTDKARLQQARVTKELRRQARRAVELFIQEILDHSQNREWVYGQVDREKLSRDLWHEGLVTVYRLLVILKLESSDDPARSFSFASTSLWRNSYSPGLVLARFARDVLERGVETGAFLETGLRSLFLMFEVGLSCTELVVKPLGGGLFGEHVTPVLSKLAWGERAVAHLLDQLLWTTPLRKGGTRERVHYGPLDVEDLGRVYEALLELEPGISSEPMCRLRRQKLEVVVPIAQGERYRPAGAPAVDDGDDADDPEDEEDTDDGEPVRGKKTKVEWIEEIPPGQFYLRVGLGRKASGSYYTPHSFVRFLVQETLGPQIAERSPHDNPDPMAILKLKALDPAMGSGHFLVEACRFIADRLYEACRLCDEKAMEAQKKADELEGTGKEAAQKEADMWLQRVIDLPDPDDEILKYLPSRSPEGEETGYSQKKAAALCRRMVAAHCLYGVDKNPLAVELAKVSLWIESHAEGMPLTFLDHRLVVGDSLTGPFWHHLIMKPSNPKEPISNLFTQNLILKFQQSLADALSLVKHLEASVGISIAEMEDKKKIKNDLDRALIPFRTTAAAWSGGVMLGPSKCDEEAYEKMLETIASTGDLPGLIESSLLRNMIARGYGLDSVSEERDELYSSVKSSAAIPALPYDLTFPEVFYPKGIPHGQQGFDVVLGNPPWDSIQFKSKEFFAAFDFEILNAPTKRERISIEQRLMSDVRCGKLFDVYVESFEMQKRIIDILYKYQKIFIDGDLCGRQLDYFRVFMERNTLLLGRNGSTGIVVPSAFHANEGATGVRRLYLVEMALRCCYSFENKRKLFEIHSSFKYALVIAQKGNKTEKVSCAFYLHDDEWLFRDEKKFEYTIDFIRRTGSEYLSFLELHRSRDYNVSETLFSTDLTFAKICKLWNIEFISSEMDMSLDAHRFRPIGKYYTEGYDIRDPEQTKILLSRHVVFLHEGKTVHQYNDHWSEPPRYVLPFETFSDKINWIKAIPFYRACFRSQASSTNERTGIFLTIPPAPITSRKAPSEIKPYERRNWQALTLVSVCNTYTFDFILRLFVQTDVSFYIITRISLPSIETKITFLAHSSLRLTCNHDGYRLLWNDQLNSNWREKKKTRFSWPVLETDNERWEVRSAIDAMVADAYGLNREQYAHVLSTFSHKSYPKAYELCLAKFDELKEIGFDAFTKKYDPYWDIPLNENLPRPVIDLPIPEEPHVEETGSLFAIDEENTGNAEVKKKRGRKK